MTADYQEARDSIFEILKQGWATTGFPILWPDVVADIPTTRAPWARVLLKHSLGYQATLSGSTGQQRFSREGFIIVQIFTPNGEGSTRGYTLSKVVSNIFEGKSTENGIWFRNIRVNEVGSDSNWFQINVICDFIYDEVK